MGEHGCRAGVSGGRAASLRRARVPCPPPPHLPGSPPRHPVPTRELRGAGQAGVGTSPAPAALGDSAISCSDSRTALHFHWLMRPGHAHREQGAARATPPKRLLAPGALDPPTGAKVQGGRGLELGAHPTKARGTEEMRDRIQAQSPLLSSEPRWQSWGLPRNRLKSRMAPLAEGQSWAHSSISRSLHTLWRRTQPDADMQPRDGGEGSDTPGSPHAQHPSPGEAPVSPQR